MLTKKKFFAEKVEKVSYAIWDLEFKLTKSRSVREGVRQDRERTVQAMENVNKLLTEAKDKPTKKKYQEEYDALNNNKVRYESQMDMIDKQINGFQGDEKHEPIIGVLEEIASLTELREMYKDYSRKF
jgi:hypothetical protein